MREGLQVCKAVPWAIPDRRTIYENGADVQLVDKPQASPIRVALNRVRCFLTEIDLC